MAYFRAFCKVGIIREALRKARFSCMETYLLFNLTGEKVNGRKNAVGFRLEAVPKFAKLLERSDEEAMDAISRILMIITEVTQNDITSI